MNCRFSITTNAQRLGDMRAGGRRQRTQIGLLLSLLVSSLCLSLSLGASLVWSSALYKPIVASAPAVRSVPVSLVCFEAQAPNPASWNWHSTVITGPVLAAGRLGTCGKLAGVRVYAWAQLHVGDDCSLLQVATSNAVLGRWLFLRVMRT